jgi:inosose dehydratase
MQNLNFAYQTLCWLSYPEKHYGVADTIAEVKEAGFRAIEFAEQLQHFDKLPDFPGLMKREGMTMASLSSGISYLPDPDDTFEETKKRGAFGARFGVKALMLCGGWGPEASTKAEELFDRLAANMDRLAEYLAQFDMKPAFHPHLQTLVETYEETERLLEKSKLGHICLDIAHFAVAGGDPIEFFKSHQDRIAMVHLKDWVDDPSTEICGKKGRFCELGEGRVDVDGFLSAATEAGYTGWLVVELDSTTRTPLDSAKLSYEYLRSRGYV